MNSMPLPLKLNIHQGEPGNQLQVSMYFNVRGEDEFERELTSTEMSKTSEFAKYIVKSVKACIAWESDHIGEQEMYNSGSLEKTFVNDGTKDLIEDILEYANKVSDIKFRPFTSNVVDELEKYHNYMEAFKRYYMETYYANRFVFKENEKSLRVYSFTFSTNDGSKNFNTTLFAKPEINLVGKLPEDVSFKDLIDEIQISYNIGTERCAERIKHDEFNFHDLISFIKLKAKNHFNDSWEALDFVNEKGIEINTWLNFLIANTKADEKIELTLTAKEAETLWKYCVNFENSLKRHGLASVYDKLKVEMIRHLGDERD